MARRIGGSVSEADEIFGKTAFARTGVGTSQFCFSACSACMPGPATVVAPCWIEMSIFGAVEVEVSTQEIAVSCLSILLMPIGLSGWPTVLQILCNIHRI